MAGKESEKKTPRGKWSKRMRIIALNILLIIMAGFALLFGLSAWLESYTRHGESVKVPAVVGVDSEDAMRFLAASGLEGMVIDTIFTDQVQPGAVVEQVPETGLPVKYGRLVFLTVNSRTKRQIRMLDISIYTSSRQAVADLRAAGFVVKVEYVANELEDLVVGAVLANGEQAVSGARYDEKTPITLQVGSTQLSIEAEPDSILDSGWYE